MSGDVVETEEKQTNKQKNWNQMCRLKRKEEELLQCHDEVMDIE